MTFRIVLVLKCSRLIDLFSIEVTAKGVYFAHNFVNLNEGFFNKKCKLRKI